jgi:hypothetical protein
MKANENVECDVFPLNRVCSAARTRCPLERLVELLPKIEKTIGE